MIVNATHASVDADSVVTAELRKPDAWTNWLHGSKRSSMSAVLERLYAISVLRRFIVRSTLNLENGAFHSATLRAILRRYYGVTVGAYSYGSVLIPGRFPPNVTVGRYVSIGPGVLAFTRNHPQNRISTHPFFFNARLGAISRDNIESYDLCIGHDVWIGANAIITPSCRNIGLGAIVGAGSVVTRPVPAFTVVAGNPARFIRQRCPDDVVADLVASRWWMKSIQELRTHIDLMARPLDDDIRKRLQDMTS